MLLADGMDEETKNILKNKDLFPGLEKISFFESPFGGNIVEKNLRMYQVLKKTMQDYKPDIVIAPSDMWPAEMFLFVLAYYIEYLCTYPFTNSMYERIVSASLPSSCRAH